MDMKKALLICSFTFQYTLLFSQSTNEYSTRMFINEKQDTLLYRMLVPREDLKKKLPLVIFLHGAGERGNDNAKQLTHGASLFLKEENRAQFPAYVIFPQCPENDYWSSVKIDRVELPLKLEFDYNLPITKSLNSVRQLIREFVKSGNIGTDRIYIVGLSMGGMGTFEIIHRFPKLFAAAISICGGGDTKLYSKKAAKIPFWVFHGETDNVVQVEYSRSMVSILKSQNANTTYTEYPNVNHGSWENAFQEPEFLSWLFSQKK